MRTLAALLCAGLFAPWLHAQAPSAAPPNVVLIITDDVGYGDCGGYGAPDLKTPNIDRLARDGVRLTDFYANGATCSPTRAGLISGRYQQRFAIEAPLAGEHSADGARGLPATGTAVPADAHLDAINLLPVLERHTPAIERTLFWRISGSRPQQAVRAGDWKLIYDR